MYGLWSAWYISFLMQDHTYRSFVLAFGKSFDEWKKNYKGLRIRHVLDVFVTYKHFQDADHCDGFFFWEVVDG